MRLQRVGAVGAERPVLLGTDGHHYDLSGLTDDLTPEFFRDGGPARVARAHAAGELFRIDVAGQRVGAPLARPGAVLCIGQNYAAHAAESGAKPPAEPILFYKGPNALAGPEDDVLIPRGSERTDWEVELGVVIGKRARYLGPDEDPLDYVAGYVLSNDVSERTVQLDAPGGQWSKGKSSETFNPLGPWVLTAEELPVPQAVRLRSWVNGETRQDSSTADMVFSVAEIVRHLSQYLVLEPGDLVNTGTPEGVALSGRFPYLRAGDVMELEAEGLGRHRNRLVQA
ncbi:MULTISPECIES: fumarylacetoacetate hydrolase family protein [Streptomyces]|uniref:Fumarylacetoacetate hydrolase family protein n=1 Tax=Streptomyces evansiae TaxID=3075535 RepID=A0ABU2QXU1_9ACTN|nr:MULTISPECIES: fumarylacetoacetate hydrolase family protein [unclassified Streptomyces]EFK98346.1 4-hydroxyphenylacetate degradation bifunctional isomerase/decarboxylase [Streptomyces sp. SPB78]MDT0408679.1 fumarylacetoacetate hydrolase family protein [Streptomyces sp. DSM 41979]MYQ58490.1 FAA hydrolase family protein [Streptomyces sp. SID4926]SCE46281.1 2-keto-4-pentenoate hydratase/2-oxohepta-3-ene-1,7-dioic acid hydratase (catechol pathway) [Streptomyces sp. DfronAA-171]